MISANTIVGARYRVTRPLGGGGMKLVYLAEDLRLAARPCALAEMVDSFTNPEMQRQAVTAFQREADMLAALSNEHIPRIYDRFSDQNRHYLVMEYVDGTTLEETLKAAGGKLDEARVIDIALQILDTLEYLHNLSPPVIYRDLKPSNVMLTRGGQVKLIDFGIARHFQPQSNATMIGTQGYAPPEQYRGKVETRSDLYALGATMHHALSGRDPTAEPPFSFPPLRQLLPSSHLALAELVDNALSYDVERRVASALEFKRRLLSIKIEALTGGIVVNSEAAAAIAAAHPTGKSQLKLPLSTGGAPAGAPASTPPSPSAPTLLTAATEIECPACRRPIPADSRFCSYCAADLRRVLGPSHVVSPEDETTLISEPRLSTPRYSPGGAYRRATGRKRSARFPVMIFVVMFLLAFAAVRLLPYLALILAALGMGGRPGEPPTEASVTPRYSEPSEPEPADRSARALALRHSLDAQGYRSVRFRLTGDTVELWGTVPTEADRLIVETTAFAVGGVFSVSDHLKVEDGLAEP